MAAKPRQSERPVRKGRDRRDRDARAQAEPLARRYRLVIEGDEQNGYSARALELPTVTARGPTPDACVRAARQALTHQVAAMIRKGEAPPTPASEARRREQVNVRFTLMEKRFMEEAARIRGFRGISDYIRTTMLNGLRAGEMP